MCFLTPSAKLGNTSSHVSLLSLQMMRKFSIWWWGKSATFWASNPDLQMKPSSPMWTWKVPRPSETERSLQFLFITAVLLVNVQSNTFFKQMQLLGHEYIRKCSISVNILTISCLSSSHLCWSVVKLMFFTLKLLIKFLSHPGPVCVETDRHKALFCPVGNNTIQKQIAGCN